MSNYSRPKIPGATLFFTVALADRGSSVLLDHIDVLREAFRRTRLERPFLIDACVILPDHLHTVWTLPEGDFDFSTRWSVIKARFSRRVGVGHRRQSHIARRERGVWQRRFWEHHVRGPDEFGAVILYCHTNPVKHGLVERAEDWPYSSVHREIASGRWECTEPKVLP